MPRFFKQNVKARFFRTDRSVIKDMRTFVSPQVIVFGDDALTFLESEKPAEADSHGRYNRKKVRLSL